MSNTKITLTINEKEENEKKENEKKENEKKENEKEENEKKIEKEETLPLFFPEHLFKSKIVPNANPVINYSHKPKFNMSLLPRPNVRSRNPVIINNQQKRSIRMGF